MYKKIVIGIDQSYARTGISIAADGRLLKIGYINYGKLKTKSEKRHLVASKLKALFTKCIPMADEVVVVCERIRSNNGNQQSIRYIKSTGALIGTIVDTAFDFGLKVYSADTRSWKSQVVGTSEPQANSFHVDPKKWPTIKYLLRVKKIDKMDLLVEVGNRVQNYAHMIDGKKYCYNDDAADSACIALYGFQKGRLLDREE